MPGFCGDHLRGEVGDVAAVVAVLGDRLAERGRLDRGAEQVHLVAAVVDVELAGRPSAPAASSTRASASPTTAQRVCPRCSGPVGLAEMNSTLIRSPAQGVVARRRRRPAATMSAATLPWAPAATVMLRNPGPAISTSATPSASSSRVARPAPPARAGWCRPSWPAASPRWWRSRRAPSAAGAPPSPSPGPRRAAVSAPSSDSVVSTPTIAVESSSGVTGKGYRRAVANPEPVSPSRRRAG